MSDGLTSPFSAPACARVCNSSINTIIFLFEMMVFIASLSFSSIVPRYFVPDISEPISSEKMILSLRSSGTFPLVIASASPSTTAVFPTPASPISTGLFFVFRQRISIMRSISCSRPIIGSIFPSFAF